MKFYFVGDFGSLLGPKKPENDKNTPFSALKAPKISKKVKFQKSGSYFFFISLNCSFMAIFMKIGQNGEPELSLEAFFEIPIYGIFLCISRYFAKCTPTLRCHKNPTVES